MLNGTIDQGMNTGDFMFYYADIFVEGIQYGNRTTLCDNLQQLQLNNASNEQIFWAMTKFGTDISGVNPPDYDAQLLSLEVIDPFSAGRPWTYQYCTEFGFFQTASKLHRVRSYMVDDKYWRDQCQLVFPELDMS